MCRCVWCMGVIVVESRSPGGVCVCVVGKVVTHMCVCSVVKFSQNMNSIVHELRRWWTRSVLRMMSTSCGLDNTVFVFLSRCNVLMDLMPVYWYNL
jgi:hypothetical protein